jgi:FkbM family methyltransferase
MSAPVNDNLIYDVGMHDGSDSAYYLRRGYEVVAIEANPELAAQATTGFATAVADGRLTILNLGIADRRGEAAFWVCDDVTVWSSFDRSIASRNGSRHHQITVPLRPMREIFEEFGLPYYAKVDIEGNDMYCLDGLSSDFRPPFMSLELSNDPLLERMVDVGFDRFKIVHQLSLSPATRRWHSARGLVRNAKAQAILERARGLGRGALFDGKWYFKMGASGPVPSHSPHGWLTYAEARALHDYIERTLFSGGFSSDWFDLHATDADTLRSLASRRRSL